MDEIRASLGRECFKEEKVESLRAQLQPEEERQQRADRCKAIGHPVRQAILELLALEPCCVCDLAGVLEVPVSTLSQHLRTMKTAGVVTSQREGKFIVYSLPEVELPLIHPVHALSAGSV